MHATSKTLGLISEISEYQNMPQCRMVAYVIRQAAHIHLCWTDVMNPPMCRCMQDMTGWPLHFFSLLYTLFPDTYLSTKTALSPFPEHLI